MSYIDKRGVTASLQSLALAILLAAPGLSMNASDDPYTEAAGFEINNALSGNWWNPDRNGEGFVIDVANAGNIVISFYTYDNSGNQMWLIGPGSVDGSVAVIDFYVTEGGFYGSNFDAELVSEAHWGTGIFTFTECSTGIAEIIPNLEFSAEFEDMTIEITRLTVPVNCD
jgi:hypothetical protein